MITNPILRGFNPDPSICRVGDIYYIATSTFEWFPGVQVFRSTDLNDWTLVARPLNRADLLDMRGVPDSCGVWAPCLSYADGKFWLAYTNAKRFDGDFKDTPNYLTWCETVDGDWAEPVYLNSSGFDPSLFHDEDGRKWLVNMVWDHRPDRTYFYGIMLQEYSVDEARLVGSRTHIFPGSKLGCTEGPHLYKRNGYYYLMTAEGGTGYHHAVTLARSRNLEGPYEIDPAGSFITAKDAPGAPLQRCGHGSYVETPDGEHLVAHLCSRPIGDRRRSPLGRESALRRVVWSEDGWLRLESGEASAPLDPNYAEDQRYTFDTGELHSDFQWLRTPDPGEVFDLSARPGSLRLMGRESLGSLFNQALLARRQTTFIYTAETCVEFLPEDFQQMAGLVCYYNGHKYHYLYLSYDPLVGRHLGIMSCEGDLSLHGKYPIQDSLVTIPGDKAVYLKAEVNFEELQFFWSLDGAGWTPIGPKLDAGVLSDEAGKGEGANFTGAFVGMCCQDLTGRQLPADFAYFHYVGRDR